MQSLYDRTSAVHSGEPNYLQEQYRVRHLQNLYDRTSAAHAGEPNYLQEQYRVRHLQNLYDRTSAAHAGEPNYLQDLCSGSDCNQMHFLQNLTADPLSEGIHHLSDGSIINIIGWAPQLCFSLGNNYIDWSIIFNIHKHFCPFIYFYFTISYLACRL